MIRNRDDLLDISSHDLVRWMDVVRSVQGREQLRVLESFWASQIRSKAWIVNSLKRLSEWDWKDETWERIYVFGGWYGVSGTLLKRAFPRARVVSIDIDPECAKIGQRMNPDVEFVTCDMAEFNYYAPGHYLIINTSTEHVSQETFDTWRNNLPRSGPTDNHHVLVLQGNNFDSIPEHIRCADDIDHFRTINRVSNHRIYSGELNCIQFTRYMTMELI
jgi:hypothetical protein